MHIHLHTWWIMARVYLKLSVLTMSRKRHMTMEAPLTHSMTRPYRSI